MNNWILLVLFLIILYLVIYLLYYFGIAVLKIVAAAGFAFYRSKDSDKMSLSSCSGTVRHMCRLHGGKAYEFILNDQLSDGSAELILTDKNKHQLMILDRKNNFVKVNTEENNRYFLQWKFKKASGKCELHWQELSETL